MSDQFPSNTRSGQPAKPRKEVPEKPRPEKVVEGRVARRKKPLGKRAKELFTPQDVRGAIEFAVLEEIIPRTKDMISNGFTMALDHVLWGEARHHRSSRYSSRGDSRSRFDYNRISSGGPPRREEPSRPSMSRRGRANHNFDELVYENRFEAQEVLDTMYARLERFEVVTVADLLDLSGITEAYTDEKWGWYDLHGSRIHRTRDGYVLDLPRPEPING